MAKLLLRDATQVVLRPKHWKIPRQALVDGLPQRFSVGEQHQALPVHVPARMSEAGAEAAFLSQDKVHKRVTEIIKQCLNGHSGSFDPSWIKHKNLGLSPDDERMYSRLNKLLQPGQLREFVDGNPEFQWHLHGPKGMLISWADAGATPTRRQALPVPQHRSLMPCLRTTTSARTQRHALPARQALPAQQSPAGIP